jgi:hypothetical protein
MSAPALFHRIGNWIIVAACLAVVVTPLVQVVSQLH